jgi:hypothetical protein
MGIDVGEKYAVGITCFRRDLRKLRTNSITMKSLNQPRRQLSKLIESKTRESREILEAQVNMGHFSSTWKQNLSLDNIVIRNQESIQEDLTQYLNLYHVLQPFHNIAYKFKRRRLDSRNALKGEYDRAITQILRMANGKVNKVKSKTQVIIGIGSSPTKGQAGPFMKKLVEKLKSLGYNNLYSVKEYFTSQKCPICKSTTRYVGSSRIRIKHCEVCDTYHHRDEMAGHNIANILEEYALNGRRPEYLAEEE